MKENRAARRKFETHAEILVARHAADEKVGGDRGVMILRRGAKKEERMLAWTLIFYMYMYGSLDFEKKKKSTGRPRMIS